MRGERSCWWKTSVRGSDKSWVGIHELILWESYLNCKFLTELRVPPWGTVVNCWSDCFLLHTHSKPLWYFPGENLQLHDAQVWNLVEIYHYPQYQVVSAATVFIIHEHLTSLFYFSTLTFFRFMCGTVSDVIASVVEFFRVSGGERDWGYERDLGGLAVWVLSFTATRTLN